MKRLLLILAMVLIITGCSNSAAGLPIVSAKQVHQQLDKQETLVVVIGQSTCSACMQYRPVLKEILANYKVDMAYVELDKDKAKDVTDLVEAHLKDARSTPTTYVFKDGVLVSQFVGAMDYKKTKAYFEENGVLN